MRKYLFLLLLLVACIPATAQVVVNVKIDSLQLLIGQQTAITLDVTCDANQHPILPHYVKEGQSYGTLTPGVEVVKEPKMDTVMLNEGQRMQLIQRYIITSFDSALYYLPPMEVQVDTTRYPSKALALQVYSFDVDTIHTNQFFGPKDIQDAPFSWDDWAGVVYASLLVVLLLVLTFVMLVWLRQGNPIIRIIRHKTKLPPHTVAMNEIQRIKEEKTWASDDSKEYYTQLTETLRTYIQDRYGFSAMDMTSSEIIERLMQENDETALGELRQLFETADLVKFAKYSTLVNENDANLVTAVNYINQTKQEVDPNAKAEEPSYTPEEMRSIGMKWTLRVLISLASLAVFTIIVLIIIRLVDLLS
ncbi:MAG: hypothetical protein KBT12_02955 [Bacteroidales bacterium]|nr:hypothetical protein [Candidatus Physcousia equi]